VPLTVGINHVTSCTADLDRLVAFYSQMFGARKVFEGAALTPDGTPLQVCAHAQPGDDAV
jgi:catechol 2,3-dioxygenase-like lactoylglutathione lyase family enzyme